MVNVTLLPSISLQGIPTSHSFINLSVCEVRCSDEGSNPSRSTNEGAYPKSYLNLHIGL